MNHATRAIDWLDANSPGLLKQLPLAYSGPYTDPFPAYYLKARSTKGAADKVSDKLSAPPDPGELPLEPKALWQQERVKSIAINPAGDLLAIQVREDGKQMWGVDLIDLKAGEAQRVARTDIPFESMLWSGDRALLLTLNASKILALGANEGDTERVVSIIHVGTRANGKLNCEAWTVPRRGRVLDVLENDPGHILFATVGMRHNILVHRIDISSEKAVSRFSPETTSPINRLDMGEHWWFADGKGDLSVAVSYREGALTFSRKNGTSLDEFLALDSKKNFLPVGVSDDANTLYALTDDERKQRELVAYDIPARKIGKTLFRKEGVDVDSVIFGSGNHPIGVRYYREGRLISDYFGAADRQRVQALQKSFPGKSLVLLDKNADGSQLILSVDGSDSTSKYYHFDSKAGRAALIEDATPWLKDVRFAPTHIVKVTSKDGLSIEAYLTLPERAQKRPLIVMPHGGPVGVSDRVEFDRDTQFLASLGYAVLRVNYRGSEGFGKSFREAGYQQFGAAIEDDIDAALTRALADYPVDPQRMCVLGFSYGGYSALISAVRWPDRFRCAISVSGPTDRILLYTASDAARSAEQREGLVQWWGDPEVNVDNFTAGSPVYRHRDIKVPVMLVQGEDDIRVDPEHVRRMQRMLELDGRPAVGLLFEDEGHSIDSLANTDTLWRGIAGFLRKYLDAPATPTSKAIATKP
jgi:dienelactone hydrolase